MAYIESSYRSGRLAQRESVSFTPKWSGVQIPHLPPPSIHPDVEYTMALKSILLAVFVSLIWGTNFVAIKWAYKIFTPFLLLGFRFLLSIVPFIFFVPFPRQGWRPVLTIALLLWMGQFSCIFLAIYLGTPPGLVSILMQSQNILTVILSAIFLNYRPGKREIMGLTIALTGIVLIGWEECAIENWLGLIFLIPGSICVSVVNIVMAKAKNDQNPLPLIVWSSTIPIIPFFLGSWFLEGGTDPWLRLEHITWDISACVCFTAYASTILASTIWAYLLANHEPSQVVPFTLLVPFFSTISAYIFLGEVLNYHTLQGGIVVIAGLAINQWSRSQRIKRHLP
jgi:O-acetylserine/cysteine efflux transporter